MADFKRVLWAFPIGIVVSLYTTLIIQSLWNWFALPAFQVPVLSFWRIYGLVLLIGLIMEWQKGSGKFADEQRWKGVLHALDACIPPEKKEEVLELIEEDNKGIWLRAVMDVFGKIVGNTLTLLIGWGVHEFLV
jgi:hypothetical protein